MSNSPTHLTVAELARLWCVSPTFIRRIIWAGSLQATRFGRAVRIARAEADRYAAAQQAGEAR